SIIEKFLPNNISTIGMSGTLWNGNIQNLVIDKVGLQNTKWSANPLNLLLGKVKADVTIDSNNLKGDFATTYAGTDLLAEDVLLNGELSLLAPYFERYGLRINGQFDANFDVLHVKNGLPHNANGTLQTFNTSILGIIPLNLGDVSSQFSEQADGILISLNNQNGELDINGVINVSESGVYNADITLSRNAITPDNVLQTVQMIGKKVGEDSVKVLHRGRLGI
ncbi:MAG: type II secretion system protein N, partial [Pseudomonadota bacterium]